MRRRDLLLGSLGSLALAQNRRDVVSRHNPHLSSLDPLSPFSVGNGEFAFTADITGLQTFPEVYEKGMPLCTQSQWGWHSTPIHATHEDFRYELFDTHGRQVPYATNARGQEKLFNWLRENPHRLNLARIGLMLDGVRPKLGDVRQIDQRLDLWTGVLESRFELAGSPVRVRTACHSEQDTVAFSIESPLLANRGLSIAIEFPYGSPEMNASNWDADAAHKTVVSDRATSSLTIDRRLDADRYSVSLNWTGEARAEASGHRVLLTGRQPKLEFACRFSPSRQNAAKSADVFAASQKHWTNFWSTGGSIDLSASTDKRAQELERRIVLSQYLTAIQCSGSAPPQETGLTCNSWFGKFHLEMHWWHAAHFPLWNRTPMLERSLDWYSKILPSAREKAKFQGYTGARWPKMTALDGRDSPSAIGPLLIWQQPHPIWYAEECYKAHPNRETLRRYRDVVMESAEFMASYAFERDGRYVLGPPVIPAQENHPPRQTWNPTYELVYWRQALEMAQKWRERLGLAREPRWEAVRTKLAPLPVRDGVYLAHENAPQTFTERNRDHPSMLCAYGVLDGEGVDRDTMKRTLHKVMSGWKFEDTWGWDFPVIAMTAARLGEPELAIDALFIESPKNRWLPNGHNWQRANLPLYLPGNGALLIATAMMAAGWKGAPRIVSPGFPRSGWRVRSENLRAL